VTFSITSPSAMLLVFEYDQLMPARNAGGCDTAKRTASRGVVEVDRSALVSHQLSSV
jgi:hypothetical protein